MRWFLLSLLILLSAAGLRVFWSAQEELEQARQAEAAGKLQLALSRYQYAMRWYLPFSAAPKEAAEALWSLAQRDDPALARAALWRLRGGIRATRWLISPFKEWVEPVDERLALLMAQAQQKESPETILGRSEAELRADHLRLLKLDQAPAPAWSLLLVLSFLAWILASFALLWRGFDPGLRFKLRPGLLLVGASFSSLGLWIWALFRA